MFYIQPYQVRLDAGGGIMIGYKILLTGVIVFVLMAITDKVIDPAVNTPAYNIIGLTTIIALIATFSGMLIMVWSL